MKIGRFLVSGTPVVAVSVGNGWIAYDRLLVDRGVSLPPEKYILSEKLIHYLIMEGLLDEDVVRHHIANAVSDCRLQDDTQPLLPLRPGKMVCVARNYIEHAKETGHNLPPHPVLFGKSDNCPIGPGETIPYHHGYGRIDHEGELAVVIGKTATQISASESEKYVFGYTIVNDVTAREHQNYLGANSWPWYIAKSMDGFAPLGPWIVTPDELGNLDEHGVRVMVNGAIRQDGKFRDMAWKVPALIEEITKVITLNPGDIIATGTPSGIAAIQPGDIVTVEIEGIGRLSNPVG